MERSDIPMECEATFLSLCLQKYASELVGHQYRIAFLRYNLDLGRVFGVINTPVYNHVKPSNNVWPPLTTNLLQEGLIISWF